ncbi:BCCT family transporter [Kocuria palustris]|uniref:BCCT family transporter n=1 Tax=Kocuria palustris TaxID=71999 RepID=UPI00119D858C|nr:BCCT family transporter [Kocuria palustris]
MGSATQEPGSSAPPGGSSGQETADEIRSTPATEADSFYDRQNHLRGTLRESLARTEPERRKGLDKVVFGCAAVLAVAFVAWGFISPEGLGSVATSMLDGTITNFGWLYVIAATVFVVFVIALAFSKFGKIPLGRDGEKPQFTTASWISMMFATGMGIGLVFYGVGEPLWFYMSPPPETAEPSTSEAMRTAMGTTLFHWTLYPWAMYAVVGLGMAYGTFRLGRSQLFSSMFTSVFGRRFVNGIGGRIINILAILATLFGSACSLGLGALQIGGGITAAGMMDSVTTPILVGIITVLTIAFVASAVSGIERGIQFLSNSNMVLAVIIAIIVFVAGPTLFILDIIPNAVGAYIQQLPEMASRTNSSGGEDMATWLGTWSIFYWAWWVSWAPFVGLFIARISRGRTVRQFIAGVLVVPSGVSTIWFAIFGGAGIGLQQRAEQAGDSGSMLAQQTAEGPDINFDAILFDMLGALPLGPVLTGILVVLTVILIGIFFVTGADSASIVMGGLSENGAEEPSKGSIVFWGVATGAVAAVMLLAGGSDPSAALNGLKNITIVSSLPFMIVMLILCVALYRDLSRDPLVLRTEYARQILVDTVAQVPIDADGPLALTTTSPDTGEIPVVAPERPDADDDEIVIRSSTLGIPGSRPGGPWDNRWDDPNGRTGAAGAPGDGAGRPRA